MAPAPLASVVVPACDERAVIGRCLRALATGVEPGELDVIVVANGCHDDTAAVAKAEGAVVVETPVGGKANAIRLGDAQCRTFPRLYLDADSELTGAAVRDLVTALAASGRPAAAPTPEFVLAGASWPVRGFHRALSALLADRRGLSGTGAYLLAESGHDRVFPLPDIVSDDGWVHRTFGRDERLVVDSVRATVRLPRSVPALIRRRTRVRLGNRQLDRLGRVATEPPLRPAVLVGLVRAGTVTPADAACFLAISVAERLLGRWRAARGSGEDWGQDHTTRTAEGESR